MMPIISLLFLLLLQFTDTGAQNGWRMDGFNSSRTNVSPQTGPTSLPTFRVIGANVSASLKRLANDGSLILTDGTTISSYTGSGQMRWRKSVLTSLNGPLVDLAVGSSGVVYASSANTLIALDPATGQPGWSAPFFANTGDESGPLVVGKDGTIYFHTGGTSAGFQERFTAINPDGTLRWEYLGNTGRGYRPAVFTTDESTVYLYQHDGFGDLGRAIGLSSLSGKVELKSACDVKGGIYAFSDALDTGGSNSNLLKLPTDLQNCAVSASGLLVTGTAAALNAGLLVVETPLPGTDSSYAAIDSEGRTLWSRNEPLIGGFADTPGNEGRGTFFAVAPKTNELVAIRIATGDELWRQRFPARISGMTLGADKSIYLVSGTDLFRSDSQMPNSRISLASPSIAAPSASRRSSVPASVAADATGLVAAFGFSEGSGSTTADSSTSGFNGTLVNGTLWTTGKNGTGLFFDGLDDKVVLPATLDIAALPFTLEAWINPTDFADWRAFFSKRDAWAANLIRFDVGLAISTGNVYVTTYNSTVTFAYVPPVNTWTHLTVVATSTGTLLYVNGALQETLSAVTLGTGATAAVAIGGSADDDDHFAGTIDDLRLYSRALSQTEIQTDMSTPVSTSGPVLQITQPLPGASISGTTVNVTYTATGDLSQVNHVHFILDSNPLVMDMTFDGVYQFTNVPTGSHVLNGYLARVDHSKILGSDATPVSFTTSVPDTTPPTATVTSPLDGSTVSGSISVIAAASDNIGVAGVQFLLDGLPLGAEDTSAPYSITWNTTSSTNGSHTLAARARDLAGNLGTSTSISVTVSNSGGSDPSVVGQWSAPATWPLVPVHLNVLATGKVLAWDNSIDHSNHLNAAVVWDPTTNAFTDVTNAAVNVFCAGQTQLADGKILVVGGHIDNDIGINAVTVFDPFTLMWTSKTPMSSARWYAGATTLGDGRVLALVGTTNCKDCIATAPEVYNPTTDSWQTLTGATSAFARYYPHSFVLPNGKVLVAGTSQVANATQFSIPSRTLDVNTQTWTTVDPATNAEGLSVMYQPGKIVRIGGSWDDGFGYPLTGTAVLDMTAPTPAWRSTAPMQFSRVLHNVTLLPDGSVLTTGGSTDAALNPPANAVIYTAELWNPTTETWTTLSNMQTPRLYHSTTALLPDGRVLVAGGGRAFTTDQFNAEIYSPPYLFKGARPTITSAPSQAGYGGTIFVATPNGAQIASVSLVRPTSVTHTTNFNQRFIPLTFQAVSGGLNVTLPANGNVAPPGYYMLFLVNGNGVPSVASFVRVDTDSTPPVISAVASSSVTSSGATVTWTTDEQSNSQVEYGTTVSYGQSSTLDTSLVTSHSVTLSGLSAGTTYHYRVKSRDGAGNLATSGDNTFTTSGAVDTTPPTAPSGLTATAAGTTQINLAWTASTDNVGVTGYRVERCMGAGCSSFAQIATPSGTTYNDPGLTPATSYSYRVRATDAAGNLSGYSNVATAVTNSAPPPGGPVAAYSFDAGSGTSLADLSGNGNTGAITSGTWTTSGKYGSAVVFNGSSSRVTINDSASLHLTTGMTLEAWVYPTAAPSGWRDLIYKQNDSYMLDASSSIGVGPTVAGTFGNGFQSLAGGSALPVNAWTHVATTFDGAKLAIWVNGVQVASQAQTSPLTVSTLPLQIGGDSLYGQNFTGRIDEVRVYNRALTQTEIEVDMNTPVGTVTDTTAPTTPGSVRSFAGGAPPSVVGRQAYINSTALASHTSAAFDSTGGDLIVVFGSSHANVTMTLSDSKGNTWISAAGPTNHTPGVDLRSQVWYAKAPNVGTGHTVTMNLSAAQPLVISVLVIKGSNTTAPLDAISSITDDGGTATTSIGSATINATKPADLLIDFAKSFVGATWTAGTGYTFESLASSNYLVAEDWIAGIAGSYTAGWTLTPATNWQNVILGVVSANASASNSQITTTWSPSTDNLGVTGYLVERCTGSGCSNFTQVGSTTGFSTLSYTDTGLTAGTTYTYRVRSKDAAGNLGVYSNTVAATTTGSSDSTAPTAPASLTAASASTSQINLTWTASTDNVGVTGYMIERCQGAGCSSFAQVGTNATTSYSDTGLLESASYSYRVRATDAAGNLSGYSNVASSVTDTRPTAPSTLTATAASGTQINLSWTASTSSVGISNYLVERCQGAGCSNFVQIATPATTTYSDTGLSAATTYSYRVRASDTHNNLSVYSNTASATTLDTVPPSAPSNLTATSSSTTQINLTWTASTDNVAVTGYRVERCQGAGCTTFAQIASPTAANYNDNGLTPNASYSYRVRATDAAGNLSGYSSTATATTADTVAPTAPSNLAATASSTTQIDLSWTASTDNVGVTGYQVERCQGAGCTTFAQIASPTAATYSDTGVTAGVPYSYRVRATDAAGNLSGYSNTVTAATADTVAPSAPSSLTATAAGGTQINLSWTASTDNIGVTGYLVERCQGVSCSSFAQIASPTATTYSDTGLTSATSYSYRVRATDGAGNLSGYSNTANATTADTVAPSAPSSLTATAAGGTQINLSWTASTDNVGVTGYRLERCQGVSCASFAQIASPTATTYSDTGLTSATSYSYRVRATDAAGNLSGYSNTASATTADTISPSAPSSLTATAASGTQINLSWTASTDNVGVTGYQVERCQGVSCASFAQIASPTATTYSDIGLTAGASYSYRVRATDAAGNFGGYSNVATATTPAPDITPPTAPSNLAATAAGSAQINLTWTASTDNVGVTGYRVERCLGSGCSTFTQIATPAGVSYSDTGLTTGASYSYRVRATDAAGNLSVYSNVASATTTASNGLVAAYSFNEGTGTTVADSSGNGNAGTISNTTWSTSGKYSNTLVFNGTSSLVTINDSPSLDLTSGMTLEAWVYPTNWLSGWVDVIYKQNDVYMLEASSTLGFGPTGSGTFGNGFQAVTGPSAPSLNTWTHIAVTFDGANLTLWVNGVSVASQPQTSPLVSSNLPLQIGGDSIYGQYFTGRIDEVRVYNRALAQSEIEVDMNTPVGPVTDTTAPAVPSNLRAFAGGTPPSIIARQSYINTTNKAANTTATFNSVGGDLIVVFASSHENVATMTLTDNKANTWITAAGPTNHPSSSVDLRSQIWYAKAAKVGSGHTVTVNLSTASSLVVSVVVIKGSNTTSPIDVTSSITDDGGTATTSITSAAITTTQPADLLLDFAKSSVGVTWTAATGYTFESTASSNYLGAEDAIAAAAGSYTAGWTMTPANNWHNVLTSVVSANASFSSTQITMTWNPSTDNIGVTGYVIERCQGAGCSTFTQIGNTSGFSTNYYTDTALSAATTYVYRIRARDGAGNLSSYSSTATATTTP